MDGHFGLEVVLAIGWVSSAAIPEQTMPLPAAVSGSKLSETSIQAQTWPARMTWAMKELAQVDRPLDGVPMISVMAPTGRPPSSRVSRAGIPVETVGSSERICGEKAEGIRCSREDSSSERRWAARDIFALYSPKGLHPAMAKLLFTPSGNQAKPQST